MQYVWSLFVVGLLMATIGLIGGLVMAYLIEQGNTYIFEHPPEKKEEKENEGNSDGHSS